MATQHQKSSGRHKKKRTDVSGPTKLSVAVDPPVPRPWLLAIAAGLVFGWLLFLVAMAWWY